MGGGQILLLDKPQVVSSIFISFSSHRSGERKDEPDTRDHHLSTMRHPSLVLMNRREMTDLLRPTNGADISTSTSQCTRLRPLLKRSAMELGSDLASCIKLILDLTDNSLIPPCTDSSLYTNHPGICSKNFRKLFPLILRNCTFAGFHLRDVGLVKAHGFGHGGLGQACGFSQF
jgi:hypothetical protein